jgi:hypothetical protein
MYLFHKSGRVPESSGRLEPTWLSWSDLVKRVIARFARGNIAAQEGRVLLPEEQDEERDRAHAIARAWRHRAEEAPRS